MFVRVDYAIKGAGSEIQFDAAQDRLPRRGQITFPSVKNSAERCP